jgi:diguanylate cyclase (GGDEF)-like protein/PAS domain S-box-containing protein
MVSGLGERSLDGEQLRRRIAELEARAAQLDELRRRLEVSEARLEHAQRMARLGSWESDLVTEQAYWSDELFRIFGFEPGSFDTGRFHFLKWVHPGDRARVEAALAKALAGEAAYDLEFRIVREDGEVRTLYAQGEVEFADDGRPLRLFGTAQDITERKAIEEALRESEERFRLIAETVESVFWLSTPGIGRMLYVSPAYERIWGRTRESLYADPRSFIEAVHPEDRERVFGGVSEHAAGRWNYEYRIVRPDGTVRWILDRGFPIHDAEGRLVMMTGSAIDITERKRMEEKLAAAHAEARRMNEQLAEANRRLSELSHQDPLTGVANRRYLERVLGQEWRVEARHGQAVSLLSIDVDYFKPFNDIYGHPAGDGCLRRVAAALAGQLKRPADLLARVGGEEFIVLLPETGAAGAGKIGERLRQAVAELAIPHDGSSCAPHVTVSVGVASCDPRALSSEELVQRADEALYRAKAAGRNRVAGADAG